MKTKPTLEITYEVWKRDISAKKDPAFYVWDADAHQHTASVIMGDRLIRVFCDGKMRINLWDSAEARERGDDPEVIRYSDQLVGAGLNTDKKLWKAVDAGRIEWDNNAWFDLYAYGDGIEDGWLNCVHHDLDEAILQASGLIKDDEFWKEIT